MFARLCQLALVSSLVAAPLVLTPREADGAVKAYLKVKGQTQGDIKGDVLTRGHEGSMRVLQIRHEIDVASGQPTTRKHKPIEIVIELDGALPQLLRAMISAEPLPEVSLPAYGKSVKGTEEKYYEIKLTNAHITSYRLVPVGEDGSSPAALAISFVYETIEWKWAKTVKTVSDEWETAPVGAAPKKKKSPQPAAPQ